MPQVRIICRGFNGAYQHLNNGRHYMEVPLLRYMAASVTVGFQRFRNVVNAGPRLWMHRLGQGFSGVSFLMAQNNRLYLTQDHGDLDGSEKSAMSYWQGMVFAKLAAEHVLGVRWLAHADALEKSKVLERVANTDKRADMAGRDEQGRWHVIEAKGYSSHPGLAAIQNAKDQAGVVAAINHAPPETTCASIARLWRKPIDVLLDDPKPGEAEKWEIDDKQFWEHYYAGIRDFIREGKREQTFETHPGYVFASLSPVLGILPTGSRKDRWKRAMIGLPVQIFDDVTSAPEVLPRLLAKQALLAKQTVEGTGGDGITFLGGPEDWDDV